MISENPRHGALPVRVHRSGSLDAGELGGTIDFQLKVFGEARADC